MDERKSGSRHAWWDSQGQVHVILNNPVFGYFLSLLGKQWRVLHVKLISQHLYLKGPLYIPGELSKEKRREQRPVGKGTMLSQMRVMNHVILEIRKCCWIVGIFPGLTGLDVRCGLRVTL